MDDFLSRTRPAKDLRSKHAQALNIPEGEPVLVEYKSKDVPLPPDFLSPTAPPAPDAIPITYEPIDWSITCLPNNDGLYAVVLDNVLSPSECATLVQLAESSVESVRLGENEPLKNATWMPAMVTAGQGQEVLDSGYRNSDRIVWDCQEMVDRLLARCLQGEIGEVLLEKLAVLHNDCNVTGYGRSKNRKAQDVTWKMAGLSKRMRFLRYGEGQFFAREYPFFDLFDFLLLHFVDITVKVTSANPKLPIIAHCDGNYSYTDDNGTVFRSFFTFHFYLNDSVAAAGEDAQLVGGATSFLSGDAFRKIDVECKTGRVLIFQQRNLYHAGADVVEGTKYTVRTELVYELIRPEKKEEGDM